MGWGVNTSSALNTIGADKLKLQLAYGEGIGNYMNDGGLDIAPDSANIFDADAETVFRVAMEGIDEEMVKANNNTAVWLIKGYTPGPAATLLTRNARTFRSLRIRPAPSHLPSRLRNSRIGAGT